jgi:hypothetical protein
MVTIHEPSLTAKEIEDSGPSGLSSTTIGNIIEDQIKEQILWHGKGLLSVYKPVSDTEAVDLIVLRKGTFRTIFLQVKGRTNLQRSGRFLCDVRMKTFHTHRSYFVVGAYFDPSTVELHDWLLLAPSEVVTILAQKKRDTHYRITTPLSEKVGTKWAPYIYRKQDLAGRLIEEFEKEEA